MFVLALVIAVVVSGQVLMMMQSRRPFDARLRDLGRGGDGFALLLAGLLTSSALGALVGSLVGSPAGGAATGLVLALLTWTAGVIWAHRRPQPPPRHR